MNDLRELKTIADLDQLLDSAGSQPILIYKHSLTCGTSGWAFEEIRDLIDGKPLAARVGLVIVQLARPVSDEIARRFAVRHESPQALLIEDGRLVWRASHHRVTAEEISAALGQLAAS